MPLLQLLRYAIAKGRRTVRYPFEPDAPEAGFRGKPEVDLERCTGCTACAPVCPSAAITSREESGLRVFRLDYALCVFCGRCEEACADGAIRLTTDFELAARSREDLRVEASFKLFVCPICSTVLGTEREKPKECTTCGWTADPGTTAQ
jgi:hydrogenase-4 component H